MAVGPFLTHDIGLSSLMSVDNWIADPYYAVLATTAETPDRASQVNYSDITNECTDVDYNPVALSNKTVDVNDAKTRFDCGKISFGSSVTIAARYLYILKGTSTSPGASDEIVGHIDLDGLGNAASISGEFSFDPDATDGLFYATRSVGI